MLPDSFYWLDDHDGISVLRRNYSTIAVLKPRGTWVEVTIHWQDRTVHGRDRSIPAAKRHVERWLQAHWLAPRVKPRL